MPDNYITSVDEKGSINISEDVINVMVMAAVSEIDGVAGLSNAIGTDIAEFLGLKNNTRGVKVSSDNGRAVIDILVMIRYGYGVAEVARKIQEEVSASVEAMTGVKPVVNIHVTGIAFEKTDVKG